MRLTPTSEPAPERAALEAARRRSTRLLIAGAALASIGHIAAVTVVALAARDLLGEAALAGASTTTIVIGSALGASLLARTMVQRGRRFGLVLGFGISVGGALVAALAIMIGSFWLLLGGTLLFGFGNSSIQLSRYAAADMAPPARRAWAIGLVVWAATAGAIVGPNIAPLAASVAEDLGTAALAGPFLVSALFVGLAGLLLMVLLRPDPYQLAQASSKVTGEPVEHEPMRQVLRRPAVTIAIIAMITGQVVMVAIMTMTPVHMGDHGHDLAAVGLVISAHTAGMFAFSPVSGRIAQRLGNIPTILAGAAVLFVAAVLAAAAPADQVVVLAIALFLLGYGWNLAFVSGSALLVSGVAHAERTQTEGFADTLVWGSSAVASLASGLVLALVGYAWLGFLGAVLLVLPVVAILRLRRGVVAPATAAS